MQASPAIARSALAEPIAPTSPVKLQLKVNWRSLNLMSIIKLIGINQYTLAIYYTSYDCYKYSIIDDYGIVYEPDDLFFSASAAELEGREAINAVSN